MIVFPYHTKPMFPGQYTTKMCDPLINGPTFSVKLYQTHVCGNWHARFIIIEKANHPVTVISHYDWALVREIWKASSLLAYVWFVLTGGKRIRYADLLMIAGICLAVLCVIIIQIAVNTIWP